MNKIYQTSTPEVKNAAKRISDGLENDNKIENSPSSVLCGKPRSGFTLIELLVVILIIGVLAAAALPQYQKIIAKTRYAALKLQVVSIAQAQEVYHLANGEYAANMEELDVVLPPPLKRSVSGGRATYTYEWGSCILSSNPLEGPLVECINNKAGMGYDMRYKNSKTLPQIRTCFVLLPRTFESVDTICQVETGTAEPSYVDASRRSYRY